MQHGERDQMVHPKEDFLSTQPHMHYTKDKKPPLESSNGNHGNYPESAEAACPQNRRRWPILSTFWTLLDCFRWLHPSWRYRLETTRRSPEATSWIVCNHWLQKLVRCSREEWITRTRLIRKTNIDRSDCDTTTNASDRNQDEMGKQRPTTCRRLN